MEGNELDLEIKGMTCEGCAITIKNFLKRDKGVKKSLINWKEGTGKIFYDPSRTSEENILKNRVFSSHYSAKIVDT